MCRQTKSIILLIPKVGTSISTHLGKDLFQCQIDRNGIFLLLLGLLLEKKIIYLKAIYMVENVVES